MRLLAAEHAVVDPQLRGWRRVLAAERECSFTPFLLAAHWNGELSDSERRRLERHLGSCLICQAAELRFGRAERVFDGMLQAAPALGAITAAARAEQATTQFERVPAVAPPAPPPPVAAPTAPARAVTPPAAPAPATPAPSRTRRRPKRTRTAAIASGAALAAVLVARRRRPLPGP